eukprot:TRINITY_DN3818_c0_g1_i14.p1 TRINITY_DN3818_c0_g1~~TRINITY_DN3818_c0_g1_i14.p1  ORF type:complete len:189 (+),score=52.03 TRINITY_DN3818_c0_g1_i14:430-996(+)
MGVCDAKMRYMLFKVDPERPRYSEYSIRSASYQAMQQILQSQEIPEDMPIVVIHDSSSNQGEKDIVRSTVSQDYELNCVSLALDAPLSTDLTQATQVLITAAVHPDHHRVHWRRKQKKRWLKRLFSLLAMAATAAIGFYLVRKRAARKLQRQQTPALNPEFVLVAPASTSAIDGVVGKLKSFWPGSRV